MKSTFTKIVSVLTLGFFLVTLVNPVAVAVPAKTITPINVSDISVPSHIGSVVRSYTAPGSNRVVVHIQDAHCNYSAQRNISAILENVTTNNNVRLIGIEGAKRWINTAILNAIPGKERRSEVIDSLLYKSLIDGATGFAGNQEKIEAALFGVESKELYLNNLKLYGDLSKNKIDALAQVTVVKDGLSELRPHILNEKLLGFIDNKLGYRERSLSYHEYLSHLAKTAKESSISLSNYPNIENTVKSLEIEEDIDFGKVDTERTELIDSLTKKLEKDNLQELVTKSLEFRTGKLKSVDYYTYIEGLIPAKKVCDNLRSYIKYVKLNSKSDSSKLAEERKALESKLESALIKNETEAQLISLLDDIDLLEKLFSIKLIRNEYKKVQASDFSLQKFLSFINEQSAKYKTGFAWKGQPSKWEKVHKTAIDFYKAAHKREDVFIDNLVKQMDIDKLNIAALITGGFHTSKVEELLKEKGISYVVVRPGVTQRTPAGVYTGKMNRLVESMFGSHTMDALKALDTEIGEGVNISTREELSNALVRHGYTGDLEKALEKARVSELPEIREVAAKIDAEAERLSLAWTPAVSKIDGAEVDPDMAKELGDSVKARLEQLEDTWGRKVNPIDADPGVFYCRQNKELDASRGSLRMFEALLLGKQFIEDEIKAILAYGLGHEAEHASERGDFSQPLEEEIRVAIYHDILALRDLGRPLLLKFIQLAEGRFKNTLAEYGIRYAPDLNFARFLVFVLELEDDDIAAIRSGEVPESIQAEVKEMVTETAKQTFINAINTLLATPEVEYDAIVVEPDLRDAYLLLNGEIVEGTRTRLPGIAADFSLELKIPKVVAQRGISGEEVVKAMLIGTSGTVQTDVITVAEGNRLVLSNRDASEEPNVDKARKITLEAERSAIEGEKALAKTKEIFLVQVHDDTIVNPAVEEARLAWLASLKNADEKQAVYIQFVDANSIVTRPEDEALARLHTASPPEGITRTIIIPNQETFSVRERPENTYYHPVLPGMLDIVVALAAATLPNETFLRTGEFADQNAGSARLFNSLYSHTANRELNPAEIQTLLTAFWDIIRQIEFVPIEIFDIIRDMKREGLNRLYLNAAA